MSEVANSKRLEVRYLSGAEPVEVAGYGVGVMVRREFLPDGWEGEPMRLVLLERKNGIVAAAFPPTHVAPTTEQPAEVLITESWNFVR